MVAGNGGQKVLQLRQQVEQAQREVTRLTLQREQLEEQLAGVRQELVALGFDPDGDLEGQLRERTAAVEGQVTEIQTAIDSLKKEA